MQITLSPEQVALMRAFIAPINAAHADAECEPPGFTITLSFVGPYGCFAEGQCGAHKVDLGEVEVTPFQGSWSLTDDAG